MCGNRKVEWGWVGYLSQKSQLEVASYLLGVPVPSRYHGQDDKRSQLLQLQAHAIHRKV